MNRTTTVQRHLTGTATTSTTDADVDTTPCGASFEAQAGGMSLTFAKRGEANDELVLYLAIDGPCCVQIPREPVLHLDTRGMLRSYGWPWNRSYFAVKLINRP